MGVNLLDRKHKYHKEDAGKEVHLEVKAKETRYMLVYRLHTAGQNHMKDTNHSH
jgi:hypothetical protein